MPLRRFALITLSMMSIALVWANPGAAREGRVTEGVTSMLDSVPPAPWSTLPPAEERSEKEVQAELSHVDLIPGVRKLLGERIGGHWFSYEAGVTTYNIGVVDGSRADEAAIESLRDEVAPSMILPIRVVAVPRSETELVALNADLAKARIGALVPNAGIASIETRADLGKIIITIENSGEPVAQRAAAIRESLLLGGFPSDGFLLTSSSEQPGGHFLAVTRDNIPLYRAGKWTNVPDAIGFGVRWCTVNFVWEDDVTGNKKGGTAGHCGFSGDRANDIEHTFANFGGNNTFWPRYPSPYSDRELAHGDATFLNNIVSVLSEGDMKQSVMVGDDEWIPVTDSMAMQNIAHGTIVCATGYGLGFQIDCGAYTLGPNTFSLNISGPHPRGGSFGPIDIDNTNCGTGILASSGDSGGPLFLDRGQGQGRYAVALGVMSHFRGYGGHETCWDAIGHIAAGTPNQLWFP